RRGGRVRGEAGPGVVLGGRATLVLAVAGGLVLATTPAEPGLALGGVRSRLGWRVTTGRVEVGAARRSPDVRRSGAAAAIVVGEEPVAGVGAEPLVGPVAWPGVGAVRVAGAAGRRGGSGIERGGADGTVAGPGAGGLARVGVPARV